MKVITLSRERYENVSQGQTLWLVGEQELWNAGLRLGEPDANGPVRFFRPLRDKVTCSFGWGKLKQWRQNRAVHLIPSSPTPAVPLEMDLAEFSLPSKGRFNSDR